MTFDDDFLSLVDGSNLDHAGIIYVQQAGRDIGDVVKAIDAHLEDRMEDDRGIHYSTTADRIATRRYLALGNHQLWMEDES